VRWIVYAGMVLSLSLLIGGLVTPSPASLTGGSGEVRGALRISRHPLLMGVGLFGILHLLAANTNAAELAFFAGFPVFVVLGCQHQDRRKLASLGAVYARFQAETAFLPFSRRGGLQGLREMPLGLGLGVVLAVLLRFFHPSWFGGSA